VDTEKDLGWRLAGHAAASPDSGMIAARHFNTVSLEGEYVIKTASRSVLQGEMFFYSRLPDDISDLFPKLISCSGPAGAPETLTEESSLATPSMPSPSNPNAIASMTLQRIHGVTFSHLITNRCLTPGRLTLLLDALFRLHSSSGDPTSQVPLEGSEICSNYLPKIEARWQKYRPIYSELSDHAESMFSRIQLELGRYQHEERYRPCGVVHGDPVFSNVLLTDELKIRLLDMRGELGKKLTLQGDTLYDLSKVYQSLLGYDYIILSQPLLERDTELLEELRDEFRRFVADKYPEVDFRDVVMLTASHYFGIVPLHQNRSHQHAYLHTCQALLSSMHAAADPAAK